MNKEEIKTKIYDIIADNLYIYRTNIKDDSNLINDLGFEELDDIMVYMAIEEEFNIDIETSDIEKIKTVNDLIELTIQKQKGKIK